MKNYWVQAELADNPGYPLFHRVIMTVNDEYITSNLRGLSIVIRQGGGPRKKGQFLSHRIDQIDERPLTIPPSALCVFPARRIRDREEPDLLDVLQVATLL